MKNSSSVRMSPLARKLCGKLGLNPGNLRGTGPRGKIMAADVLTPAEADAPGGSKLADPRLCPSGEAAESYLVFRFEADMARLAAMSTPIAVQCEKLLGGRYSLFDYIVRAAVKARTSQMPDPREAPALDLLLVEHGGELRIAIPDAGGKTIYRLACETRQQNPASAEASPGLIVCDAGTPQQQVDQCLSKGASMVLAIGGTSPKIGIECGRPVSRLILPLTLYINRREIEADAAERLAMELKTLLENPVVLLLL